jgi:hypothetical protein
MAANNSVRDLAMNADKFLSSIDSAAAAIQVRSVCLDAEDAALSQELLKLVK